MLHGACDGLIRCVCQGTQTTEEYAGENDTTDHHGVHRGPFSCQAWSPMSRVLPLGVVMGIVGDVWCVLPRGSLPHLSADVATRGRKGMGERLTLHL